MFASSANPSAATGLGRSLGNATPRSESPAAVVWLPWLVRLRWISVAGQLLTVAVARWAFGLPVPTRALMAVVASDGSLWVAWNEERYPALDTVLLRLQVDDAAQRTGTSK